MLPLAATAEVARHARAGGRAGGLDLESRTVAEESLALMRAAWDTTSPGERALLGPAGKALAGELGRLGDDAAPEEIGLTLEDVLGRLGITALRPGQDHAMTAALAGRDALVVMATGSGKSLCYQAPAAVLGGLSVVISPLIALIADQYRALSAAGLPVAMLTSQMDEAEQRLTLRAIAAGEPALLYVAPERFASRSFVDLLRRRGVELLVVDEAHCVSEWGHDFRPDYRRIGGYRDLLGARSTIALTATATRQVRADIIARLGLRDPAVVVTGFDRPNLTYDVVEISGRGSERRKWQMLTAALTSAGSDPAIVYCGTRRTTEELAERLASAGWTAAAYHAGRGDRASVQAAFMAGEAQVMCATNAFGMGVDKPDIRLVVHWALPDSLEQYYQEAGRAGRDGLQSRALLLSASGDIGRVKNRIGSARAEPAEVQGLLTRLASGADEQGRFSVGRGALDDRGRFLLSMANRIGVAREPTGAEAAGQIVRARLSDDDDHALRREVGAEVRRRWRALDALLAYAGGGDCRRAAILAYFDDPADGAPEGRCCDVCAAPADLVIDAADDAPATRSASAAAAAIDQLAGTDRALFEALREWRAAAARDLGWPAFRVTANRVLMAIVAESPQSGVELEAVPGAGPWLREHHGARILEIVAAAGPAPDRERPAPAQPRPAPVADDAFADDERMERLRAWRLSRAEGKPAYTVCTDRTLRELIARQPVDRAALETVHGVGPAFMERHAESLIELLAG